MPSECSARPRLVCHSSLASGAACRPATSTPTVKGRSDDLSSPARPGPEDHAEQAFPHRQEKFEPVSLSTPRMKATGGQPRSLPSARSHRGACRGTEPGGLAARARPVAPVRPNLPMSGRAEDSERPHTRLPQPRLPERSLAPDCCGSDRQVRWASIGHSQYPPIPDSSPHRPPQAS